MRTPRLVFAIAACALPAPIAFAQPAPPVADKVDAKALMQSGLKLYAAQDYLGALAVFLDRVFHRIYAGIDIDREGLERVREATKEGCVVLLPSHKSHVDYLMLSFIFHA